MKKRLALVVALAILAAYAIPAVAQTDVETGETTFVGQAKDKAKNKDIEKEKGKRRRLALWRRAVGSRTLTANSTGGGASSR